MQSVRPHERRVAQVSAAESESIVVHMAVHMPTTTLFRMLVPYLASTLPYASSVRPPSAAPEAAQCYAKHGPQYKQQHTAEQHAQHDRIPRPFLNAKKGIVTCPFICAFRSGRHLFLSGLVAHHGSQSWARMLPLACRTGTDPHPSEWRCRRSAQCPP